MREARKYNLKEGLDGTEGPIALPDGSVIFSEINANRLIKIELGRRRGGKAEHEHEKSGSDEQLDHAARTCV